MGSVARSGAVEGGGIDAAFGIVGAGAIVAASGALGVGGTVGLMEERGAIDAGGSMGRVAGSGVVEGGGIDAAFGVVGTGAIVAASGALGAGGTVGLVGERGAAGCSAKVPEGPAGGLSMAPSSPARRRVSSVGSRDIQGRLLIASRMYLICSASDGIEGPGRDLAMKGSLAELAGSSSSSRSHGRSLAVRDCVERPGAPSYPGVLVIEFGSYVNLKRRNLHLR